MGNRGGVAVATKGVIDIKLKHFYCLRQAGPKVRALVRDSIDWMEAEGFGGERTSPDDLETCDFVVAFDGKKPVGFVAYSCFPKSKEKYAFIYEAYVNANYRRRGIYRAMRTFVKAEAKKAGCACLDGVTDIGNVKMQDVYKAVGAKPFRLWYREAL